jgi:hypothetical protein
MVFVLIVTEESVRFPLERRKKVLLNGPLLIRSVRRENERTLKLIWTTLLKF